MDLIDGWRRAGRLPALSRLIAEGFSSRLLSTPNMHSASAWTSILTGLNPGRHGLFVFSDRDFKTGVQQFFKGGDRRGSLLTAHLSRHGLTSGLLNVPMTFPAEGPQDSFVVSGLDAPELNAEAFHPAELRKELLNEVPGYRYSPAGLGDLMGAGRTDEAARLWIELIETQTRAAEFLLSRRPVDFFMTVYTASDWAGHNLWHRQDDLLTVYQALDAAIARLLSATNDAAQVYIVSDHGMGRHSGASYQLAEWLERHRFMVRNPQSARHSSVLDKGKIAARKILSPEMRDRVKSVIGADRLKKLNALEKDSFYDSIDWSRTIAYTEPGRHVINISLAGRNRGGIVPQSEYDSTCARITSELNEWVDARGTRVVERVARRSELYEGPFVERASDLYVYWNQEARLEDVPDEVRARGFWWSGDHRLEGILIASGRGIRAGRVDAVVPSVCDVVPTILRGAGLPIPDDLDGKPIDALFTGEFLAAHPIRIESRSDQRESTSGQLTEQERQLIEEKLRGLGYL